MSCQSCDLKTSRVWLRLEVVVTVEDRTVSKRQPVVVEHGGLCRSFLCSSFEATLLQRARWGQPHILHGLPAPENLQSGALDPDPILDHPDQTVNFAAAQQNHLKVPWMSSCRVEGNLSDAQTNEPEVKNQILDQTVHVFLVFGVL